MVHEPSLATNYEMEGRFHLPGRHHYNWRVAGKLGERWITTLLLISFSIAAAVWTYFLFWTADVQTEGSIWADPASIVHIALWILISLGIFACILQRIWRSNH
jgi:hypothetical protein